MTAISHGKLCNTSPPTLLHGIFLIVIFWGLFLAWPHNTHAAKTSIVASTFSLSGPAAKANLPSVQRVRLAVREINDAGGILDMPIDLLELDNLSTPIGSKVAVDKAAQENVTAIIGASFSAHPSAVAKAAQAHGIPMVTNISTSPAVTRMGDYVFRACFNDTFQGKVMGLFARKDLKAKLVVAVFNVSSDDSLSLTRMFEKTFTQYGGMLLAQTSYKLRQSHFRDILSGAISLNPDALFIAGHDESARIISVVIMKIEEGHPIFLKQIVPKTKNGLQ